MRKHIDAATVLVSNGVDLDALAVLVVDDNAANRTMLEEMLTSWRMCPTAVCNGKEAVATMRAATTSGRPFSLVILDASMPGDDGFAVAQQIKNDPSLAGSTVMMLSSASRSGDATKCKELGVASYLRKPVSQSDLFDAIHAALGTLPIGRKEAQCSANCAPTDSARPLRILLAEDNPVNQRVAIRTLERRGHSVAVANDGREAIAAMKAETFDVVLMDVQMPTMDGFEATAAIREAEKASGAHVPIVALTAHAMKGDRERCIAAGMDDYVSKPLRVDNLFETIDRLVALVRNAPDSARAQPACDLAKALAYVEGDEQLLREMIDLFTAQTAALLPAIHAAVAKQDSAALARAAHKLKSSMSSFEATRAVDAADRLERMANLGNLKDASTTTAELDALVACLQAQLRAFSEGGAACAS
ncbi:MAG: response regulator [Phycisphaerae bacterium]|nr:response regulator [Phycisphaerae bacterium]